jgi:beta-galactosidase
VEDKELTKNDWSETYVIKLIDWHLKEQENMPWLTGAAYWPFKDFSTPVRPENPVPYVNQKGVIERDFTKKESFYVFQSYWTDAPMVHIVGHSQPVRWGDENESKEVLVYSNCSQVELFVNGESQGVRKRDSQNYPAAGLRWSVKLNPGDNEVKAVAIAKNKTSYEDSLNWVYQTAKWGEVQRMIVTASDLGDGYERVDVKLVDKNGIACLDSDNVLRFEIAGDGELLKNQGTITGSVKVQAANGRASIKVKRGNGKSVIAVKSDKLETQFLTLN